MSKLSDACKELKNEIKISKMQWENIATKCARAILDLEFSIIDGPTSSTHIAITPLVADDLKAVVNINLNAKSTSYEIRVASNQYSHLDIALQSVEIQKYICTNLEADGEVVDIGELKFYIENKLGKKQTENVKKNQLHKELDNGFKKDGRARLGGETLENDIAFNEYLHRKFKDL